MKIELKYGEQIKYFDEVAREDVWRCHIAITGDDDTMMAMVFEFRPSVPEPARLLKKICETALETVNQQIFKQNKE